MVVNPKPQANPRPWPYYKHSNASLAWRRQRSGSVAAAALRMRRMRHAVPNKFSSCFRKKGAEREGGVGSREHRRPLHAALRSLPLHALALTSCLPLLCVMFSRGCRCTSARACDWSSSCSLHGGCAALGEDCRWPWLRMSLLKSWQANGGGGAIASYCCSYTFKAIALTIPLKL